MTGANATMNPVLEQFLGDHPGRDLDRDGLRLHYIDEGSGEAVVMLHGNPTWSFTYRHLIEGLRDSYRVIVPDHIGCGLSDKPDDSRYDYTLDSRVRRPRASARPAGPRSRSDPGGARLGRHHRHNVRGAVSGAHCAAGRLQHRGISQAREKTVPLGPVVVPGHTDG